MRTSASFRQLMSRGGHMRAVTPATLKASERLVFGDPGGPALDQHTSSARGLPTAAYRFDDDSLRPKRSSDWLKTSSRRLQRGQRAFQQRADAGGVA